MIGKRRLMNALLVAMLLATFYGPAVAQQTLSGQPAVVRVEGLQRVIDALQSVERKLDLLLSSRWEYRSVKRNRLRDSIGGDDVADVATKLGKDGWELVSINAEEGYVFKRRILPR